MRRRTAVTAAVAGVPAAFVLILAIQARLAAGAEYLPDDPGYVVQATLLPAGGAAGGSGGGAGEGGGSGQPLRMVMLGDSTVAGVGSPTVDQSLPALVGQRVADALGRPVEAVGLGVSGARTADIRDEQIPMLGDRRADVVVLVVGSNDVTHATPPWRFRDNTRGMLRVAARSTDAPLVVGGIPLFGSVDALAQPLRWVVDTYARPLRSIQRDVAAEAGVRFVNIAVEASPRFEGVPEAMSSDGFHPAPVGYGFWADALAAAVVDVLKS